MKSKGAMKLLTFLLAWVMIATPLLGLFPAKAHANEVKKLELVNYIDTSRYAHAVIPSPKGDMLMIHESSPWAIHLYSIKSGVKMELPTSLQYGMSQGGMRFSFDGSLAVYYSTRYTSESGVLSIIDTRSGEVIKKIEAYYGLHDLAFDRNNNLIHGVFSGGSYGIIIRDIATEEILLEMLGHISRAICHSPVQDHVASFGRDAMIRICNSKIGGFIRTIDFDKGHFYYSDNFVHMEYSPNGKYLVVANHEKANVYDVEKNYSKIHEIDRGGRVSFTNDNELLMIGSAVFPISQGFTSPILLEYGGYPIPSSSFLNPDGKTIIAYNQGYSGIRVLDASSICSPGKDTDRTQGHFTG